VWVGVCVDWVGLEWWLVCVSLCVCLDSLCLCSVSLCLSVVWCLQRRPTRMCVCARACTHARSLFLSFSLSLFPSPTPTLTHRKVGVMALSSVAIRTLDQVMSLYIHAYIHIGSGTGPFLNLPKPYSSILNPDP